MIQLLKPWLPIRRRQDHRTATVLPSCWALRVAKMTIKELYESALKHNSEDYELAMVNVLDAEVVPVTEDDLDIDHKDKKVIIC